MRNNSSAIFLFVFIFIMLANGFGFSTFIMAFILYSIFKSVIGKENDKRDRPRDRRYNDEPERRQRRRNFERRSVPEERHGRREFQRSQPQKAPKAPKPKAKPKNNPFKKSGIAKYKDYDYDGAISDFEKALGINPTDVVVHFNIACAFSLTENKDKAYFHLSKAVEHGFNDFEKIQTHDALAYIRIQAEYEQFVKSGYQLSNSDKSNSADRKASTELLEQLQKLAELRAKGLLTEEEFLLQKKKLLL
ncbi:MAG: SHOCT domain-containing protein [Saprospiraceae bacterium]